MNDIQTQAHTPRNKPLLKAVIWIGATGFALCFLVVCGASIWIWSSVDSHNRLSAPPCPSGIFPPAEAKIAFASSYNSKTTYSDIFIINADGSKKTQLTHSSDLMDAGEPIWSKDGEKLFFYFYPNYEFWVMNADGSNLTSIPKPNVYYNLSPDEKQKVFVENDDIYLMNADGSGQNKLTSHASDRVNVAPAWSPDGTKIAFLLYYPAGSEDLHPSYNHLFTIRPDGTGLIDINNSAISFSWSPDGSRIAVVSIDREIYVMHSDGSHPMRITNSSSYIVDGPNTITWSPDGEWLAFQASNSNHNSSIIITKSTCSGGPWWIPDTSYSHEPDWQPAQK